MQSTTPLPWDGTVNGWFEGFHYRHDYEHAVEMWFEVVYENVHLANLSSDASTRDYHRAEAICCMNLFFREQRNHRLVSGDPIVITQLDVDRLITNALIRFELKR